MNRGEARTLLRRRINEPVASNWSDEILNTLLNIGYAFMLKQIRRVNMEAVIFWEYRNTVAGSNWYEKPANTASIIEVGFKGAASATAYATLTRKPYYLAKNWRAGLGGNFDDSSSGGEVRTDNVYCHRGNSIGIFPAPSISVTGGLQVLTSPVDTLSSDTDNFLIELTLQYGIVLYATILAKGESPEDDAKEQRELARLIADIAVDYADLDSGQPIAFNPNVANARGYGYPTFRHANDIDPGR